MTSPRRLAAVVQILTKAVESVADTLSPVGRARPADGLYGYGRPLVDAWEDE